MGVQIIWHEIQTNLSSCKRRKMKYYLWRWCLYQILIRGIVSLGNNKARAKNTLLVEILKNNFLSVSQTCDQGHILIFDFRKKDLGKLVVFAPRTWSDVYIFNKEKEEKCCMGQINESGLWHRIMVHIIFDNLVKISKRKL